MLFSVCFGYIGVVDELRDTLSFILVVLETRCQEEHGLKSQVLLYRVSEAVVGGRDFPLKLNSISCVEWSLPIQELKKNDSK